jgi:hypothetical protein
MTTTYLWAGNAGLWTSDTTNAGGTITNLGNLNAVFEKDPHAKRARVTFTGTPSITTTAAGLLAYNLIITKATIAEQFWPKYTGTVTCWNQCAGDGALDINLGSVGQGGRCSAAADATNVVFKLRIPTVSIIAVTPVLISFTVEYFTSS